MTQAPGPDEAAQGRVERVLEQGLEQVDTPAAAEAIVARLERLNAGHTEQDKGEAAAQQTASAVDQPAEAAGTIERAAERSANPEHRVADMLSQAAAHSVAQSPASEPVMAATQAMLTPEATASPGARRGRRLLKEALLRRMGPLNALDASIYLAINEAPHPRALDTLAWAVAMIFVGGWIWVIATLAAYLVRVPKSWTAVKRLLPSVVIATWIIEYPIKAFFRRRRPFARIVEALVIGKKPGSWSFPSGHTGSSFASAWILSTVWPRGAPLFYTVASAVGLSRVYVGAHYPGDVVSGAILGTLLSELVRRVLRRVLD